MKRRHEPSGRELVEWTENDFPGRTPKTRAARTVGIGVTGTVTPSPVIANFCTAPIVGEQGDDPTDPTTPWPVQRPRITAGVLKLETVVADQRTRNR